MQGGLFLDVVVGQRAAGLQLLAGKDQALRVRGNTYMWLYYGWVSIVGRQTLKDTFLVLDLGLDRVDGVRGLHIECDGLTSQRLHEDLRTHKILHLTGVSVQL